MRKEARVSLSALLVVLDVPADKLIRPRADGTPGMSRVCTSPGLARAVFRWAIGDGTSTLPLGTNLPRRVERGFGNWCTTYYSSVNSCLAIKSRRNAVATPDRVCLQAHLHLH